MTIGRDVQTLSLAAAMLVTLCLTGVTGARAESPIPSVLQCTFSEGQVRSLENGAFTVEPAADLIFDIGNVDLAAQTAELITDKGSDQLRIVRAINANHFLEVVTEGFLNLTTVFEPVDNSGKWPAVHSRHFGLLGQPVLTHYTGFCEARN